jgi:hypothetical protein
MRKIIFLAGMLMLILLACDHGLDPAPQQQAAQVTGISGTIYFSNWPPADSLYDLRIVAFRNFPPLDIFNEVLNGQALVYPPISGSEGLPFNVDSVAYTMELETGEFKYITVAQQFGPVYTADWRSAGQYDITPQDSLPSAVMIESGVTLEHIDIYVDFDNLPIQPF